MPKTFDELKDIRLNEVGLTLEELQRNVDESAKLLAQVKAMHKAYLHKYLAEDRAIAHAQGLVHSDAESNALEAVLTTVEDYPQFTTTLAKTDGGSDDDTLETPLIYARLQATKSLQAVGQQAISLGTSLLDTAAKIGENAKPITQAAYRILKPIAATNANIHTSLEPALSFHKGVGRGRPKKSL